ncbi:MAG: efflux RND transporter periplasmic adaptor subunit [candidate division Zixibacteria bacterium]|nr:efflux RND transporter periplasmic adaptor subunit [candidate division Zixibacteria bacterium]
MSKKRRRRVIWTLVVAGALLAAIVIFKISSRGPGLPEVEVMELAPGGIVSTVSADGELEALNQVDISAEIVAKVEKVYVKEGDEVERGQILCALDDDELRSQRDLNRSRLDEAAASYKRGKALFEENLISEADFDARRTAYEVAKSQLEQSEDNLSKTRLFAPISGRVVRVDVEEGETVVLGTMNNPGTVMFTLGNLSAMQAKIYVDEADIVDVSVGQRAKVTPDAMPDAGFDARVSAIGYMPATEADAAASDVIEFEVVLDVIDIDARLRPGMSVSGAITTAQRENVLTCPLQAIGRREGEGEPRDTVFVLEGGRAKLVPVKTGISDGTRVEIVEGVKAGQRVIVGPYTVLRALGDGDDVRVYEGEGEWPKGKRPRPRGPR